MKTHLEFTLELLEKLTRQLKDLQMLQTKRFTFDRSNEISYLAWECSKLRRELNKGE